MALPEVQFADLAEKRWEYFDSESDYLELYGDPAEASKRHRVVPLQVWSRGAGDVWVAGITAAVPRMGPASLESREVVLRTRAVQTPLRLPSNNDLRLEMLDARPVKDFVFGADGGICLGDRLTTFMSLPDDAPKAGPVPQVEALLQAHPELVTQIVEIWEVQHRGRRVVAFMADGVSREQATAMLAALAEVVPERRSFACRQPLVIRPLRTADAMKAAAQKYATAHPAP